LKKTLLFINVALVETYPDISSRAAIVADVLIIMQSNDDYYAFSAALLSII